MLKTIVAAIVSALTAHFITKHHADKNIISLHRSYDRKLDTMRFNAYGNGWDAGNKYGYGRGYEDGIKDANS